MKNKPCVLIIGPTPPPYMGPSVGTKMIVESEELREKFQIVHLDTVDRRDLSNIGKLDFLNICLATLHVVRLFVLLIQFSPDIVYLPICQTVKGFLRDSVFIILSRLFGARIVIHLRGGYFRTMYDRSNFLARLYIWSILKKVSRVIVLGECLRYIFEGLMPSTHIAVVPNGLDRNFITEQEIRLARSKKSSINSKKHVLFLSNLIHSKGFFDVIRAIPEVIEKNKNIMFTFSGSFREANGVQQEVMQFISYNKITRNVLFTGSVGEEEKKQLLLSSGIFVMPTYYKYEGQPWVIIEAMAAGLPIITTDHGCINEMVVDGKNGYLVKKQNPSEIAKKILLLLSKQHVRARMGAASRKQFMNYYTKDNFIKGLEKVFISLMKRES
jgi:glycosyltransferase involved in cell wall biosynthesis